MATPENPGFERSFVQCGKMNSSSLFSPILVARRKVFGGKESAASRAHVL
jgi:hypothetical protein